MFSFVGTPQSLNIAAIYNRFTHFRQLIDTCIAAVPDTIRYRVHHCLLGVVDDVKTTSLDVAIPAQFIIQYCLAQQLMTWGVNPLSMCGYGIGECVAACLAGVFDVEAGIKLAVARGSIAHAVGDEFAALTVNANEIFSVRLIEGTNIQNMIVYTKILA